MFRIVGKERKLLKEKHIVLHMRGKVNYRVSARRIFLPRCCWVAGLCSLCRGEGPSSVLGWESEGMCPAVGRSQQQTPTRPPLSPEPRGNQQNQVQVQRHVCPSSFRWESLIPLQLITSHPSEAPVVLGWISCGKKSN